MACTGFPECKTTKPVPGSKNEPKSMKIACPECSEGIIMERRSRRGTIFYSCSRYPDCKYALSKKKAYAVLGIGNTSKGEESQD